MDCNSIKLPKDVSFVIKTIRNAGYEAFIVGGCVRDAILGKTPTDWDITTSALPMEVKGLFRRTVDTGIKHGTVTVLIKDNSFEVTTYRLDGVYEDSRHPKEVSFTGDLGEDLKRRDFTINAMAYDEAAGLIDMFGGIDDLKKGIIRCVGDPKERFTEDALRIMRALRFSAQLGFKIEEDTGEAMRALAGNLKNISSERIQTEFVKLLLSPHPERLREAYEYGITCVFLPEFDRAMECEQNNPHHCFNVGEHTIHALMEAPPERIIRLALLFHDLAKPYCLITGDDGFSHFPEHNIKSAELSTDILRRLKFDNYTIKSVNILVKYHDMEPELSAFDVRKLLSQLGEEYFIPLLQVKRADILAQSDYKREEKLENLNILKGLYDEILKNGDCFKISDLKVRGQDLMDAGVPQGKAVGEALKMLLEEVIKEPSLNSRDKLLKLIKEKYA